ncbi:C-type lectin domain-containing protein [Caenorhabditis elegans]|uniref:C-type lectin domain-containing protein n=1 Tax=Caenorhabditis elegans TaxID=6239 RepID=O44916_CAEEL|nr:C-type lectin domain-containing protein [Caenorhabditis elegans]CCD73666.2 C-type lectin domain-containing protein [Caenorhabditis elegans]|eukprot:NP_494580.2 C-type LECtin [Caenorhabditis elegans]
MLSLKFYLIFTLLAVGMSGQITTLLADTSDEDCEIDEEQTCAQACQATTTLSSTTASTVTPTPILTTVTTTSTTTTVTTTPIPTTVTSTHIPTTVTTTSIPTTVPSTQLPTTVTTTPIPTTTTRKTTTTTLRPTKPRPMTKPRVKVCPYGWATFNRPSGKWCIKVFIGHHAAQADAEEACRSIGTTLTGLQNKQEALFIQKSLLSLIPQQSGSVWLGLQRTARCMGQPLTATCSRTTAFEWTDNSATGTDGFLFQTGQPDNGRLNQNCALFLASIDPFIDARGRYYAATFEDVNCVATFVTGNMNRKTRGFACGMRPT